MTTNVDDYMDNIDLSKNVDLSKNIDLSKCCNTESLLLAKLWNDDDDIMSLLVQRVCNIVVESLSQCGIPFTSVE